MADTTTTPAPDAGGTLTAEQADFILDWLDSDMDDALAQCEETDENGRTIYELAGAADAKGFLSDLVETLTPIATPVDDEEDTTDDTEDAAQ